MITDLPQYSSNETFQPAGVVSNAPTWETIKQSADSLTKIAATEIYKHNQIQLQANKYDSAAQISEQSQNAYLKASQNKDVARGLAQFNAAMDGIGKGVLNGAYKQNAPYIKRMLTYQTNKFNMEFANQAARQSKALGYSNFVNANESLINEMSNAASRGDLQAAFTFHGQLSNMITDGVKGGLLMPTEAAVFSKNLESHLYEGITLGQYKNAVTNGIGGPAFRKNFLAGKQYDSWFDVDQKQQMLKKFNAIDTQFGAADGVTLERYSLIKKQMVYDSQNGRPINQGSLAEMVASAPEKAPELLNDISNGYKQNNTVSSAVGGTVSNIKSKIADLLNPKVMPKDVNEANNNRVSAVILTKHLKDLMADPVQVIRSYPAYQNKLQQINADKSLTESQLNVLYQTQMGMADNDMRAITNSSAKQAVTALNSMPLGEQMSALNKYIDSFPGSSKPYVLRDLQRNGMPLASQYLYRINNSDKYSNQGVQAAIAWGHIQVINGANNYSKALSDYSSVLEKSTLTFTDINKNINLNKDFINYADSLMATHGDSSPALKNFKMHAELFAAQLMSTGQSSADAISTAVKVMLDDASVMSYKGNTIMYDREIPKSTLKGAMDHLIKTVDPTNITVPEYYKHLNPDMLASDYKKNYLRGASCITSPLDDGVYLADQNGFIVTDNNNKNIGVTWKELKDPNSAFMKSQAHSRSVLKTMLKALIY